MNNTCNSFEFSNYLEQYKGKENNYNGTNNFAFNITYYVVIIINYVILIKWLSILSPKIMYYIQ